MHERVCVCVKQFDGAVVSCVCIRGDIAHSSQ